jgi:hypothetical protein
MLVFAHEIRCTLRGKALVLCRRYLTNAECPVSSIVFVVHGLYATYTRGLAVNVRKINIKICIKEKRGRKLTGLM